MTSCDVALHFMTSPAPDEIRAWRREHGLSAARAGDLVYVTGRTWLRWEAGDAEIPLACWDLAQRRVYEARTDD